MEPVPGVRVRRARPSDAERIASFINRARPGRRPIAPEDVQGRFGIVGFLIAERDGEITGLLGWLVENLVARVTDFLIWPAEQRLTVGRALISTMEEAARELQCEAAMLFLPRNAPPELIAYWEAFGYRPVKVASLPKAWREAAQEARSIDEQIVLKPLREEMVQRPL